MQRSTERGLGREQDMTNDTVVAQWLRGRASDSRLRGPRFESCAAMWKLGQVFSLYIAPVHLAVWMSTYRQWWIFVYEQSSQNCRVAECFPEKPRWSSIEQVCQGVKCTSMICTVEDRERWKASTVQAFAMAPQQPPVTVWVSDWVIQWQSERFSKWWVIKWVTEWFNEWVWVIDTKMYSNDT